MPLSSRVEMSSCLLGIYTAGRLSFDPYAIAINKYFNSSLDCGYYSYRCKIYTLIHNCLYCAVHGCSYSFEGEFI